MKTVVLFVMSQTIL